jgi:glycosidase
MNGGKFDGGRLSPEQRQLHDFYARLLTLTSQSDAIRQGKFYELQDANNLDAQYNQRQLYTYVRYTGKQKLLIVVNFSPDKTYRPTIRIPQNVMQLMGLNPQQFYTYSELLSQAPAVETLNLTLAPQSAYIFEINPKK